MAKWHAAFFYPKDLKREGKVTFSQKEKPYAPDSLGEAGEQPAHRWSLTEQVSDKTTLAPEQYMGSASAKGRK